MHVYKYSLLYYCNGSMSVYEFTLVINLNQLKLLSNFTTKLSMHQYISIYIIYMYRLY